MFQNIGRISLISRIFNVHGDEWPRVNMAWLITLLYRVGFVIGWTTIVGLLVMRFGISYLPHLFAINAVFTILGSLFFSSLFNRFKKETLLVISLFCAVIVLFAAYYFANANQVLFFLLLVSAEAFFLVHYRIMLTGYIEERFNPVESERVFPLIESSETIGGIIAGLVIVFLTGVVNTSGLILLWIILLLLSVPLIFLYRPLRQEEAERGHVGFFTRVKKEFQKNRHVSFVKYLFLIVFLQWLLFNLLDFQYTKAVYQDISNVVMDSGAGFEHAFVHNLGQLFILFSGSALLIQLFFGSRIIKSLGIVGTMIVHPIVTLLSLFGLTVSYNFTNAVIAKNNFTVTSILHLNAYHGSFYAVNEESRECVREVFDGIARPLGAILGTFALIILQKFAGDFSLVFYVNLLMIIVTAFMLYFTIFIQGRYTRVALNDLLNSESEIEKLNAVDILAQKGHQKAVNVLVRILHDKNSSTNLKVRILRAFSELKDISVVFEIMRCFAFEDAVVREAALDALHSYSIFKKENKKHLVLAHAVVCELEKLYKVEKNIDIRSKIISLLSNISSSISFEFLLKVLNTAESDLKADAILALSNFNDPEIYKIVRPFLSSSDRKQRLSAMCTLGKFKDFKDEVLGMISSYVNSGHDLDLCDAIYAIGELKISKKKRICFEHLHSRNVHLKLNSAIALAKMGYYEAVPALIDLLFHKKDELKLIFKKMFRNVDVRIAKNLDRIVKNLTGKTLVEFISNQ